MSSSSAQSDVAREWPASPSPSRSLARSPAGAAAGGYLTQWRWILVLAVGVMGAVTLATLGAPTASTSPPPSDVGGRQVAADQPDAGGRLYLPVGLRNGRLLYWPAQTVATPAPDWPGQPMHLYGHCVVREEQDEFANNTTDSFTTTWYNGFSLPTRREYKFVGYPSHEESLTLWQYDSDGRLLRNTYDKGRDGRLDFMRELFYDEMGRLVRAETDTDGSGVINIIDTFEYDDNSRLIRLTEDTNGDGATDVVREYEYDEQDRLVREIETEIRYNNFVSYRLYFWQGQLLVRKEFHWSGRIQGSVRYMYDELDRLVRFENYQRGDDTIGLSYWYTLTYDDRGSLVLFEQYTPSGRYDSLRWTHDAVGRPTSLLFVGDYPSYVITYYNDCPDDP